MLYRFREAQAVQLGLVKPKERRPYLASDCNNLKDAEKWRQQIIREISRKVSKIQDGELLFNKNINFIPLTFDFLCYYHVYC